MKKKFLAFLLTGCLVGAMLSGCGNNTPTTSSTEEIKTEETEIEKAKQTSQSEETQVAVNEELSGTLSILSWYDEGKADPVIQAFQKKYPNINLDFQYAPPVADYVEKLSTLLYSGVGPDIFYMAFENREDIIKGNYAEDLSNEPYMLDGTIPDSVQTTFGADGKAFAVSVDCWVGGIFYNKDIFSQVGIEKAPTTWNELLEDCKILKEAGIVPIMDNCQDAAVNFTAPLFGSEVKDGNPKVVEDIMNGKGTFREAWTKPVTMWKEGLIDNGYLTESMVGATSDEIITAFATGQTAMVLSGSWNVGTIESINPELNYECIGVPGTDKTYYCGALNVGVSMNAASENKDLARAYLEFIASPEGLEAQYNSYGGFTIANGYSPEFAPEVKTAVENVKEGNYYIPMADWVSYTESLRLTYLQSLQDCMVGTIKPEEVGARLDAKLAEVSK